MFSAEQCHKVADFLGAHWYSSETCPSSPSPMERISGLYDGLLSTYKSHPFVICRLHQQSKDCTFQGLHSLDFAENIV